MTSLAASADQQPFLPSLLTGRSWPGLALQLGAQSERQPSGDKVRLRINMCGLALFPKVGAGGTAILAVA